MNGEGTRMEYSVLIAGFGGQGVLLIGDLLAYCGMKEGREVTWMPSYGVEMRGGAVSCTVVLSRERIGAPVVGAADAVIAMSEPALHKFGERLLPRGLLLINSSFIPGVEKMVWREDLEVIPVPAGELAGQSGAERMANLIMLGVFLGHTGLLEPDRVAALVPSFLAPEKQRLVPEINKALACGCTFAASLARA